MRRTLALAALLALVSANPASGQPRMHTVGVLLPGGSTSAETVEGLREGLQEQGFEEGKHYALLLRDVKGDLKAVAAAAQSLEAANVDLIFSMSSSVTVPTMKATQKVPIVFHAGADAAAIGLVENYRKPGGRLTGVSSQSRDLTPKRLELLKDIVPTARRVVTFYKPSDVMQWDLPALRDAGHHLKIQLIERSVRSADELRSALRALRPSEVDAIFYVGDTLVRSQMQFLIDTALEKRLPTMIQDEGSVRLGALAAYGVSYRTIGRLAAKPVYRILLGARPGDIPVEQIDRLHLAVNLKTAKAIGVTIPKAVLDRADEVVQ